MPSTWCHEANHTHIHTHTEAEMGVTRILKDFMTLFPSWAISQHMGKPMERKMQDVSKVGSTCLSCIVCLTKLDEFQQGSLWDWTKHAFWMWLGTSNHHNLTIPIDDMHFDAVEETVAAAPAALKTPMLVTSARGSLITKTGHPCLIPAAWLPRMTAGMVSSVPAFFPEGLLSGIGCHTPFAATRCWSVLYQQTVPNLVPGNFNERIFYSKFEPMNFTLGNPSTWLAHNGPLAPCREQNTHFDAAASQGQIISLWLSSVSGWAYVVELQTSSNREKRIMRQFATHAHTNMILVMYVYIPI